MQKQQKRLQLFHFLIFFYLKGFPWLNPKLELTIIATQKVIKITRNTTSLHFLLCLIIPSPFSATPPSLEGYFPITAPKGPLISTTPKSLCKKSSNLENEVAKRVHKNGIFFFFRKDEKEVKSVKKEAKKECEKGTGVYGNMFLLIQ